MGRHERTGWHTPLVASYGTFGVADGKLYYAEGTVPALWAYGDYMAKPATLISPAAGAVIPVDPSSGWSSPFTFTWEPMGSATGLANNYAVLIWQKAGGMSSATFYQTGPMALPNAPSVYSQNLLDFATGAIIVPFWAPAGTEWEWTVAAIGQVGADNVFSLPAAPSSFSIAAGGGIISPPHAGPILTSPTPGDQDVDPGCAFSWAPMAGVTEYELIIATDAALTQPVAGTPVTLATTAFGPVTLEYSTDYYYAVRATAPTSSVQSIGAFRTIISPEEEIPPVLVEQPVISPAWIWAVVIIGALLVIAVLVLIMRTRRV